MDKSEAKSLFKNLLTRGLKEIFKRIVKSKSNDPDKKPDSPNPTLEKSHPWRICPIGQHWVTTHPLTVPATENQNSYTTIRDGHCANNPERQKGTSVQDYLSAKEMTLIAETYFKDLSGPPATGRLSEFKDADKYDAFIRGWTKYWNEVLKPSQPLDPNLVKALIASESGFRPNITTQVGTTKNFAHGLMQVTDETQKILMNVKGELRNHLIHIDRSELTDPNLNIGAGIRWLFHKKKLAESKSGHDLSWADGIQKYKAEKKGSKLINIVFNYYNQLKGDEK